MKTDSKSYRRKEDEGDPSSETVCPIITESRNGRGWKGPLKII